MINPETLDLSALPSVTLEAKSQLPTQSAIYFAIDSQGIVQYIGRSTNIHRRWLKHHRFSQLKSIGDIRIAYLFVDSDLLSNVETALVKWFQPPLNWAKNNLPNDGLVPLNVRIPESLHEKINRLAESEGRLKQFTVARLLEAAIAKSDEVAA